MAKFNAPVLTDAGSTLLARAIAGEGELEFTALKTGDGTYDDKTPEALAALVDIKSVRQVIGFSGQELFSPTQVKLTAIITNESLHSGYYLGELGIFARIRGTGEAPILYCISVTAQERGDFFPAYDSEVGVTQILQSFILTVARASNVRVVVDGGLYALLSSTGMNADLETEEKGTLVGAINEIKRSSSHVEETTVQEIQEIIAGTYDPYADGEDDTGEIDYDTGEIIEEATDEEIQELMDDIWAD